MKAEPLENQQNQLHQHLFGSYHRPKSSKLFTIGKTTIRTVDLTQTQQQKEVSHLMKINLETFSDDALIKLKANVNEDHDYLDPISLIIEGKSTMEMNKIPIYTYTMKLAKYGNTFYEEKAHLFVSVFVSD